MVHPLDAQLQMVYPESQLASLPPPLVPAGYHLRTYQQGDEVAFYRVMEAAGFGIWDDDRLKVWIGRIIPDGWYFVIHTGSREIVATAMALHDHSDQHPFGGELGWVAADPAHTGQGLGMAVCAAVTMRMIAAGYRNIHLYTEQWRLAAIKTYLKLGYVPFLYLPEMLERWRVVCTALSWSFTPELWRHM
jgi:mycothiol synthase